MEYTKQQMCGHKDFSMRTFTGNWREDVAREAAKMRDSMLRLQVGGQTTQGIQRKLDYGLQKLCLTPEPADGYLRFGDVILLQSAANKGALAADTFTEVKGRPAHALVTLAEKAAPVVRTAWIVQKARDPHKPFYAREKEADLVHYGQTVKLTNPHLADAHLNLAAALPDPSTSAIGNSSGQLKGQVTACYAGGMDTLWRIEPGEVSWSIETEGLPVHMGDVVAVRSVKTAQFLSVEPAARCKTAFGFDLEVSAFHHKEQHGKKACEAVGKLNLWGVVCAPKGSNFTPFAPGKQRDALQDVRRKILERSGDGSFKALSRAFRILDDNGDRKLSRREIKQGLEQYGVPLSSAELDTIFTFFDRNGDGVVTLTEFMRGIREPMNGRRSGIVAQAFDRLDTDCNGMVTFAELKNIYGRNLYRHPQVVSGAKTEDQVLVEFISGWDQSGDRVITPGEFQDYYTDLSASIDGDDYFELMIRNAWHISGGEGVCENTTCRRVLVVHNDGSQTVEEIQDDLGIGPEDIAAMKAQLRAQGITDIKDIRLTQ
ncbi:Crustacean calcium-binding protein 23 [Diplonema papillatum]|nr:Crustacean calcium-binding protein 23 [Diplonema papillatum]